MIRTLAIAIAAVVIAFGAWTAGKTACSAVKAAVTIHRAAADV